MTIPLTRFQTLWPGQMGVAGSDVPLGIRTAPGAITMYVSDVHPGRIAVGDGTDPMHPLSTMGVAITTLIAHATAQSQSLDGSVIVVDPAASLVESVVVPPTAPKGCTIMGASNGSYGPTWTPATAAGVALTLRQENWRVTGFQFHYTGNGTGIQLDWVPGSSYNASGAIIDKCHFSGWWAGLYGIALSGAPYNVFIADNEFNELRSAGAAGTAFGICTIDSSEANAYECRVLNNIFWENENHIGCVGDDRGFNMSLFQGNVFHDGVLIAANRKLDLRGGTRGRNVVVSNVFCGTYSNAGGYWPNAGNPDMWVGNIAEDIASPQVADNGFTVAVPV